MRSFVLQSLLLISRQEKRARKFPFHPRTTLVRGPNDTGKSSLLKSIYNCLGARPDVIHEGWGRANVVGILSFTVGGVAHTIVQDGRRYGLFDAAGKLSEVHTSVTRGLGPAIAKLLSFELQLPTRDNKVAIPPPAYLFLPFYVDQDRSWGEPWSAFADLAQFKNYKRSLAEYHAGIKPNEYYNAKSDYEAVRSAIKPIEEKQSMLSGIVLNIDEKMKVAAFDIDLESYRKEIEELLAICDKLRKAEEDVKDKLVHLYHDKTQTELQLRIAKSALRELSDDYKFASQQLVDPEIECPTCGQHYMNAFQARFSLARDEDRCHELVSELTEDLAKVNQRIEIERKNHHSLEGETARVKEILSAKRGAIELRDILESEGRKEVQRVIRADIDKLAAEISEINGRLEKLQKTMKSFEDRTRVAELTQEFRYHMNENLGQLSVKTLSTRNLKVHSKVTETGSDLPRALLAYYYSILHMIREHSKTVFCPVVIDSPNQQDQDTTNIVRMLTFIRDKRPKDAQLILGLVDTFGVDFEGDVIELRTER